MKKFKYRLETLLKVKEHIEKEKQKEHASAVNRVNHQENQLKDIDNAKTTTFEKQRSRMKSPIVVAEMLVCSRYLNKLKRENMAGKELLKALKKKSEEKREKLIEASRDKKIYEKLKEKQQDKYNEMIKMLETKDNDEIAIRNYDIKNRS